MNPYREIDQEAAIAAGKCRTCTHFDDSCKKDPNCCEGPFEHLHYFAQPRYIEALVELRHYDKLLTGLGANGNAAPPYPATLRICQQTLLQELRNIEAEYKIRSAKCRYKTSDTNKQLPKGRSDAKAAEE